MEAFTQNSKLENLPSHTLTPRNLLSPYFCIWSSLLEGTEKKKMKIWTVSSFFREEYRYVCMGKQKPHGGMPLTAHSFICERFSLSVPMLRSPPKKHTHLIDPKSLGSIHLLPSTLQTWFKKLASHLSFLCSDFWTVIYQPDLFSPLSFCFLLKSFLAPDLTKAHPLSSHFPGTCTSGQVPLPHYMWL